MRKEWRYADESLTTVVGKGGGRPRGTKKPTGMNGVETKYAQHLELRRQVGEVLWWKFEGITLKLGNDCRFTVDFCVMLADYQFVCIDTKAAQERTSKKRGVYLAPLCEDDSKAKIAIAASMFPFPFFLVILDETGNWKYLEVK